MANNSLQEIFNGEGNRNAGTFWPALARRASEFARLLTDDECRTVIAGTGTPGSRYWFSRFGELPTDKHGKRLSTPDHRGGVWAKALIRACQDTLKRRESQ